MKLLCLGSSSAGNCYLIHSETECLVVEAGIKLSEVKKALDFNIGKIVGVVSTHSHKDHFGHADEYLKCGIPVYASEETHGSLSKKYECQKVVRPGYWYQIGGFNVTVFRVEHDVECYGFVIRHQDIGTLLFATDTSYIKQNFKKLAVNHIMIECNYSMDIVNKYYKDGSVERSRLDRVLKTHMELQTCKEFIKANKTTNLDSIVLLHLSDGNSNAEHFQREIQEIFGSTVKVVVADKNVTVDLDVCPF